MDKSTAAVCAALFSLHQLSFFQLINQNDDVALADD
jgi:hypothetical protein